MACCYSAWVLYGIFSFYICFEVTQSSDVSTGWCGWPGAPLRLALYASWLLLNSLVSWPTVTLYLQGTCPSQCFCHWWFWTQNLHLLRKTKRCPYGVLLLFLGGIWPNLLVLVWHYTTHQCYNFLVWNSSVGQTWSWLHLTKACNNLHISSIIFLKWAHLKIGSMRHTDPSCNRCSRQSLFCTVGILGVPQACTPEYSCVWGAT